LALLSAAASAACSFEFDRTWIEAPPIVDARPFDVRTPRDAGGTTPAPDAWPPTPATLPELCFKVGDQARNVACPSGWVAIAGSTSCVDTPVERCGLTSDGAGWSVACRSGRKPQFTEVICARGEGLRRLSAQGTAGGDAEARCDAWEVVASGGCECPGDAVHTDDYVQGAEAWACACADTAAPKAHVTCLHAGTAARLGRAVNRAPATRALFSTVSCAQGLVLTGGCDGDRPLTGLALGEKDGSWVCGFDQPPAVATLTVICLTQGPQPCPR
jgi:hypothetical protein